MSGQVTRSRWRLGAVALFLGAMIASPLIWQAVSEAGAPKFEPRVLASFHDKDKKIQVSVGLPAAEKPVTGKVSVEVLDGAGKSLAQQESKVSKFDSAGEPGFPFADVKKADADSLRLRVTFKKKRVEISLSQVL